MATYTIETHDIRDVKALVNSLTDAGASDAIFTMREYISITTDLISEAEAQTAVTNAAYGGLISNKIGKVKEFQSKSKLLIGEGVEAFSSGKCVPCTRLDMDEYYAELYHFNLYPSEISASNPYAIKDVEGEYVTTSTLADVEALAEDVTTRRSYVFTSSSNADSSKGEVKLIEEAMGAANQAALDAILDTRS